MSAVTTQRRTADRLSAADLRARWKQMAADPLVTAIPYKLELNEKGSIEVSPATPRHGSLQVFVAGELRRLLSGGSTFVECPIETEIGVRVADVAWGSADFLSRHSVDAPFESAPELCVEILSPSNTRAEIAAKVNAYLAAGAREVWLVTERGPLEIITAAGPQSSSVFGVELVVPR
jgi:Uma2 family endonuclease